MTQYTSGDKKEHAGMEKDANAVSITYSAQEQRELDAIRTKYTAADSASPTRLEQIRKLDAQVETRALIAGLSIGIVSTLVMGAGMSLTLSLGHPALGILVSVVGLAGMVAAWPLYQKVLRREREKAAPEILRLSED
ncbi:MAG: hypothetical protein IJ865_07925 [Clostridia bacterium]|nr:hypothetical protein [Clostridia bacterium]